MENEFGHIWERIRSETEIKTFVKLADIIGISQPAISKAKARGKFPVDWAYEIGHRYNLLTEWIMTGEGPRRLDETQSSPQDSQPESNKQADSHDVPVYFTELVEWGKEFSGSGNLEWLENLLDSCLPAFKKWRDQKSGAAEAALHKDQMKRKVA